MSEEIMQTMLLRGQLGTLLAVDLRSIVGEAIDRMPWCHRVLLENIVRNGDIDTAAAAKDAFVDWLQTGSSRTEIAFSPLRILMHDTTCGPALVDIAAMRDALAEAGGNPSLLNPSVPVATSVDHSVSVESWGSPDALARNMQREMMLNAERYRLMKWASKAVTDFRVFPPGSGIMHTLNMERLATVVTTELRRGEAWAAPDTLVGTDSHTPMINGLGVLAWGVGGIEAEGAMLGVPLSLRLPDVIGVHLTGSLLDGVLATDLALTVTHLLRKEGVAGEFVEFFGAGTSTLTAGQRAVVANMAPEYGATTGYFAIDDRTLAYLRSMGRSQAQVNLVEAYSKATGLWFDPTSYPRYTKVVELDLSAVGPSIAGPQRPQNLLRPYEVAGVLRKNSNSSPLFARRSNNVPDGAVAIAAITSCTNTTDLELLVWAGLVARNARRLGLRPPSWVKTSLTPGSPASARRLQRAGLLDDLESLGFAVAGYGCATCIGNSGGLQPVIELALEEREVKPVAVLSGNRNFPNRVHNRLDSALLVSPPLVVAYALAGDAMRDVTRDVLGCSFDGRPIRLSDLWPSSAEVAEVVKQATEPEDVAEAYSEAEASTTWASLEAPQGTRFPWDPESTHLRRPPFVRVYPLRQYAQSFTAHPLLVLGDDVTTDHISPAGAIPYDSHAGAWLMAHGEDPFHLNVYAARRGNWEVMLRGLFTNRSLVNRLCPGERPGSTCYAPSQELLPVWRASSQYEAAGIETVIVAGERYGAGSSRDWAAKGLQLLGVRAVLAKSIERIHRTNLICVGILPVELPTDWDEDVRIAASDHFIINSGELTPRCEITVEFYSAESEQRRTIRATALVETSREIELLLAGGMIPTILQQTLITSALQTSPG